MLADSLWKGGIIKSGIDDTGKGVLRRMKGGKQTASINACYSYDGFMKNQ